jgi:hypothetical protein
MLKPRSIILSGEMLASEVKQVFPTQRPVAIAVMTPGSIPWLSEESGLSALYPLEDNLRVQLSNSA